MPRRLFSSTSRANACRAAQSPQLPLLRERMRHKVVLGDNKGEQRIADILQPLVAGRHVMRCELCSVCQCSSRHTSPAAAHQANVAGETERAPVHERLQEHYPYKPQNIKSCEGWGGGGGGMPAQTATCTPCGSPCSRWYCGTAARPDVHVKHHVIRRMAQVQIPRFTCGHHP